MRVSTLQSPTPILSVATAPVATGVVRPPGGLSTIVSKSILSLQTSEEVGQKVRELEEAAKGHEEAAGKEGERARELEAKLKAKLDLAFDRVRIGDPPPLPRPVLQAVRPLLQEA